MIADSQRTILGADSQPVRRAGLQVKTSTVHFWFVLGFLFFMILPHRLWLPLGPIRTFTLLDLIILLYAGALLLGAALRRRIYVGSKVIFSLLLLPLLLSCFSIGWTNDFVSTIKVVIYLLIALLAYYVVANLLRNEKPTTILNLAGAFVLGSITMALLYWSRIPIVWSIFNFSLGSVVDPESYEYAAAFARLDSPYWGRSNDFGTGLALFAVFFLGVAFSTGSKRAIFFFFVASLGVVLTLSRGVILSLVLVSVPALFLQRLTWRKLRQLGLIFLTTSFMLVILLLFIQAINNLGIDILASRLNDAANVTARFEKYEYGLQLVAEQPFLGFGAGRYMAADVDAVESALHNTFLEQLASFGIPLGLLSIAGLLLIPVYLWGTVRPAAPPHMGKYLALAVVAYILIASNQTSNEAVMPRLGFFLFLGFAVAYLHSFAPSQPDAPVAGSYANDDA